MSKASEQWLDDHGASADDQAQSLVRVLDLIRSGRAMTRPDISRASGYGRTVVAQRVAQLMGAGLITDGGLGSSTGGRAPRRLRFADNGGKLLVAELGAGSISVGISTLQGELVTSSRVAAKVSDGPELVLGHVEELFDQALAEHGLKPDEVWGIGVGLPGPVEYATGMPVSPPIMPGWDGYPVRERLSDRYDAPVWVDNDVNLMALGELRRGLARGESNVIFLKVGHGIGAGLISEGHLHRGAQGSAGDVGHIEVEHGSTALCRCGNHGCLEALAGGAALTTMAEKLAEDGTSAILAERMGSHSRLEFRDLSFAASHGDPAVAALLSSSATYVGQMLATLVNFHNPSMIVIGGQVAHSGDSYLATVREAVLRRSLPLATRELQIVPSKLRERSGLLGAAFVVIDELFSPATLTGWIDAGSPVAAGWRRTMRY